MYPSSSQQLPHFNKSGVSSSSLSEAEAEATVAMASECYRELLLQVHNANVIGLVEHCTRLGFRLNNGSRGVQARGGTAQRE